MVNERTNTTKDIYLRTKKIWLFATNYLDNIDALYAKCFTRQAHYEGSGVEGSFKVSLGFVLSTGFFTCIAKKSYVHK